MLSIQTKTAGKRHDSTQVSTVRTLDSLHLILSKFLVVPCLETLLLKICNDPIFSNVIPLVAVLTHSLRRGADLSFAHGFS